MAKLKHHRRSIMGRSDIPYAQRLRMQMRQDIASNRGYAARITLYIISVALHECEGIGYGRLGRFAQRYRALEDEFYEDPEVGMAHAAQRMAQLGLPISGEFFVAPDTGSKRQNALDTHALQATQVAQIVAAVAMNDEFGFGPERQKRIRDRIGELARQYRDEGAGFLLEKMEAIGFPVVDGVAMVYIDQDGNAVRPGKEKR